MDFICYTYDIGFKMAPLYFTTFSMHMCARLFSMLSSRAFSLQYALRFSGIVFFEGTSRDTRENKFIEVPRISFARYKKKTLSMLPRHWFEWTRDTGWVSKSLKGTCSEVHIEAFVKKCGMVLEQRERIPSFDRREPHGSLPRSGKSSLNRNSGTCPSRFATFPIYSHTYLYIHRRFFNIIVYASAMSSNNCNKFVSLVFNPSLNHISIVL